MSDPAGLIASIPSLVGFHPAASLVVVVVPTARAPHRGSGGVRLTMRVDLPTRESPPAEVGQGVRALLAPVLGLRPARTFLVAFPEPAPLVRPEPHPFVDALAAAYRLEGIEVGDSLVVGRHRWWSHECGDPRCCPPEGRPLDTSAALGARAELVFGGSAPFASREAVVARVAQGPAGTVAEVLAALQAPCRGEVGVGAVLRAWQLPDASTREPAAAAAALTALRDVAVRDAAIAALLERPHEATVEAGARLVSATPPGWVAPVATVLAVLGYVAGQGALAWACLDRALEDDPSYSLAHLLSRAVSCGLPPSVLVEAFLAVCDGSEE